MTWMSSSRGNGPAEIGSWVQPPPTPRRRGSSIEPDLRVDTTFRTAADCAEQIVGLVRSQAAIAVLT